MTFVEMMGNLCSDPVILYFLLGYKSMDTSYIRPLETWRRISIFPFPEVGGLSTRIVRTFLSIPPRVEPNSWRIESEIEGIVWSALDFGLYGTKLDMYQMGSPLLRYSLLACLYVSKGVQSRFFVEKKFPFTI